MSIRTPGSAPQSLHGWLYELMEELCYDREADGHCLTLGWGGHCPIA